MVNDNSVHGLLARAGGLYPPPSVINSWPRPNHANPETRGLALPIALIALLVFTFVIYSARMWARLMVAKNAGLDDLLISIAMIFVVGSTIAVILGIRTYGFQWHVWDQNLQTLVTTRQITLAIEILYLEATTLLKISILCFYRRLANGSIAKVFLYLVWASIAFVAISATLFTFLIIFSYTPVEGYWHLYDSSWRLQNELRSLNEAVIVVSVTVIGTFQDLLICALPVILVWNLRIERRQKAALIGIFGLGLLTCICGVMRTYYAIYIYYGTYDITWYAFYAWFWTALEADLGVICASAPALKVFFRRYFNLSTSFQSNSGPIGNNVPWNRTRGLHNGVKRYKKDLVPLERIKINSHHHVTIRYQEDMTSHASDRSTRNLTALPTIPSVDS